VLAELVDQLGAADGEQVRQGVGLVLDRGREHDGLAIERIADAAGAAVEGLG
jgi:hypothetical protein